MIYRRQLCSDGQTVTMKLLFIVLLVAVVGVNSNDYDSYFGQRNYQRTQLGDAIDKASLKLLRETYTSEEDKNVITSPLGVMILLSMYSNGAGAASQAEISNFLGGTDYKQAAQSYSALSSEFAAMNPDYLTLANRIYAQDGLKLNDSFLEIAKTYKSEVLNVDFQDMEKAAKAINQWANETTKGHIPEPIKEGTLSSDTILGLFNIIFFQGHWHVPFEVKNTKDEDFHVNKTSIVKKPTMNIKQTLFYGENKDIGARFLELPYKEDGFRMIIILPDEVDGLPTVLEKVEQTGLLKDVFELNTSDEVVELHFPKFEVKNKLDLKTLLPKVGISNIFTEAAPNVVVAPDPVVVTKAFQEAFVKVDEEGATAGAFTGFGISITSVSAPAPPVMFKVDHPFLFYIMHKDKVLFAGTYTH